MVLRDRNRSQEPQSAAMASDQPLKKKQRIDAPDLDHPFITELPSEESPDGSTMSEDAVDCSPLRSEPAEGDFFRDVGAFQQRLMAQCLCGLQEDKLRSLMLEAPKLHNWSTEKVLQYLSTLQLFLEVYLRQNAPGKLCTAVKSGGDALIHLEHSTRWFSSVLRLAEHPSPFVAFLAGRVVSSFLIVAKDNVDHEWLRRVVDNALVRDDSLDCLAVQKINFSLDVIKRIVEWKDVEQHPVEDSAYINSANPPAEASVRPRNLRTILAGDVSDSDDDDAQAISPCETIVLTDSESFDTSHVKCLTVNALQHHWPILVRNVKLLLTRYLNLTNAENCILTFLSLWENTISIKANLSVVDTKPFYADLQSFVELLRSTELPPLIYTQLLSLYNEVLCYGSTLALQDLLPDETCTLAHAIVRFVKDFRLLNEIHIRNSLSGLGFIGLDSPVVSAVETTVRQKDVTMLQKLTLLILKSVAVTVKEMRCDSSDSSIDSTDYNAIQDMQMVERSIRDVLKKLDTFMKNALEFHPETPFTQVLVRLFSEQDDYLIESMVCTLDITIGLVYRNSVYPDLIPMLNPFLTFVEFLRIVSYDHKVLLDYLVSNETCFLLYLLRFLKYVRRNWSAFFETCQRASERGIDGTMAVLIRLRLQISRLVAKSRFPYNISPILRLLEVCENLYEGNDLS